MKKNGFTKGDLEKSGRAARKVRESGLCAELPAVSPHAFVPSDRCDQCTCGLPITDGLHQMVLFEEAAQ